MLLYLWVFGYQFLPRAYPSSDKAVMVYRAFSEFYGNGGIPKARSMKTAISARVTCRSGQ